MSRWILALLALLPLKTQAISLPGTSDDKPGTMAAADPPSAIRHGVATPGLVRPAVDGYAAPGEWDGAYQMPIDSALPALAAPTLNDGFGYWSATYDQVALYLLIFLRDETPGEGDRLDLYLDGDYSRGQALSATTSGYDGDNDFHWIVPLVPTNAPPTTGPNSAESVPGDIRRAIQVRPRGFVIEIAVPLATLSRSYVDPRGFGATSIAGLPAAGPELAAIGEGAFFTRRLGIDLTFRDVDPGSAEPRHRVSWASRINKWPGRPTELASDDAAGNLAPTTPAQHGTLIFVEDAPFACERTPSPFPAFDPGAWENERSRGTLGWSFGLHPLWAYNLRLGFVHFPTRGGGLVYSTDLGWMSFAGPVGVNTTAFYAWGTGSSPLPGWVLLTREVAVFFVWQDGAWKSSPLPAWQR